MITDWWLLTSDHWLVTSECTNKLTTFFFLRGYDVHWRQEKIWSSYSSYQRVTVGWALVNLILVNNILVNTGEQNTREHWWTKDSWTVKHWRSKYWPTLVNKILWKQRWHLLKRFAFQPCLGLKNISSPWKISLSKLCFEMAGKEDYKITPPKKIYLKKKLF